MREEPGRLLAPASFCVICSASIGSDWTFLFFFAKGVTLSFYGQTYPIPPTFLEAATNRP